MVVLTQPALSGFITNEGDDGALRIAEDGEGVVSSDLVEYLVRGSGCPGRLRC